jgi:predicted acetyltransferase
MYGQSRPNKFIFKGGKMNLVYPTKEHAEEIEKLRQQFIHAEEQLQADAGLENLFLDGMDVNTWISQCDIAAAAEGENKTLQYLAFVKNELVGGAVIRYGNINAQFGSHIGYAVAPDRRKSGYGSQILSAVLAKIKQLPDFPVQKIQLCTMAQNLPSIKIILKNGGVQDPSCENKLFCRFFIEI